MTVDLAPQYVTVQYLRDYLDWHIENGRGQYKARIDRRGIGFATPEAYCKLGVGIPHHEDTHDDLTGRVFLRVIIP